MPWPLLAAAPMMPAIWVPCQELSCVPAASTQSWKSPPRAVVLGRGDPVARVAGIGIAAVAVVGDGRVGRPCRSRAAAWPARSRWSAQHAGVEHRDHHAGAAGGAIPGGFGIDRRERTSPAGARRYHWPTSGPRPLAGPLAYSGSVGTSKARRRWSTTACNHLRVGRQAARQRGCVDALGHAPPATRSLMVTPVLSGTPARAASRSARRCATAATSAGDWRTDMRLLAQQRRIGLERDDHPRRRRGLGLTRQCQQRSAARPAQRPTRNRLSRARSSACAAGARRSTATCRAQRGSPGSWRRALGGERRRRFGGASNHFAITRTISSTLFE